jgi:predicted transcriptional regulator
MSNKKYNVLVEIDRASQEIKRVEARIAVLRHEMVDQINSLIDDRNRLLKQRSRLRDQLRELEQP